MYVRLDMRLQLTPAQQQSSSFILQQGGWAVRRKQPFLDLSTPAPAAVPGNAGPHALEATEKLNSTSPRGGNAPAAPRQAQLGRTARLQVHIDLPSADGTTGTNSATWQNNNLAGATKSSSSGYGTPNSGTTHAAAAAAAGFTHLPLSPAEASAILRKRQAGKDQEAKDKIDGIKKAHENQIQHAARNTTATLNEQASNAGVAMTRTEAGQQVQEDEEDRVVQSPGAASVESFSKDVLGSDGGVASGLGKPSEVQGQYVTAVYVPADSRCACIY